MDKILSARVDESVIQQIGMLARELNMSKKAVIEAAVKLYSEQIGLERKIDVFENTCGAWKRSEIPQESIAKVRSVFNKSMERHHR
jgi:hypothetical protein